jgi:alanine racemase
MNAAVSGAALSRVGKMDDERAAVEAALPGELLGGLLHVDLAALKANYRQLAKAVQPADCAACIKSNAYGLGMAPVAEALWSAGCRTFFVALPAEGLALRVVLPDAVIYVLDGLLPRLAEIYHGHGLRPALSSLDEIKEWAAFGKRRAVRPKAALHLDTGLNRLGLSPAEVRHVAADRDHLACADEPSHEMNLRQRQAFDLMRSSLPAAPASLSNTPGALIGRDFAYDLVRPGIGLYGGNPYAQRSNPMRPVVHLYAAILQVRDVKPGESVGYGATWTADRDSRIAIVAAGYGDGLPRTLSSPARGGPAHAFLGGQFAPIVGRVSMDLLAIDVTDVPPSFARRGARAELIGAHVTVDDMARWAGTIPYEILTRLGSRYSRLYSGADA